MASGHCGCQQLVVATGAPAGSLGNLEEIDPNFAKKSVKQKNNHDFQGPSEVSFIPF